MLSVRLSVEADKYYRISLQIPFSPHGPCYREETVRQIHVISLLKIIKLSVSSYSFWFHKSWNVSSVVRVHCKSAVETMRNHGNGRELNDYNDYATCVINLKQVCLPGRFMPFVVSVLQSNIMCLLAGIVNGSPSHLICFPFTEPGHCIFFNPTASGPRGAISWIWQKVHGIRILDCTLQKCWKTTAPVHAAWVSTGLYQG